MHFTSKTSSNGVIERNFILDEITGVLWSPTSGVVGSPLLLAGHSGGMHKKAPGLVASALHSVTTYGFTVAAIDAPGHGDRPRNLQDQRWAEAIHQARAANREITIGVCGEHGGDPASIEFFAELGVDYVSCSPARIPIAQLSAARIVFAQTIGSSADQLLLSGSSA